jgi:hypothetical protein
MTLESMFYISQTVAGLAIVVSLLFVGMEVRHSNRVKTCEESPQPRTRVGHLQSMSRHRYGTPDRRGDRERAGHRGHSRA